jgi:hypothetical protein
MEFWIWIGVATLYVTIEGATAFASRREMKQLRENATGGIPIKATLREKIFAAMLCVIVVISTVWSIYRYI